MLSGYSLKAIIKTLLLRVKWWLLVAFVRGDRRIDYDKATRVLGRRVQLAN